MTLNPVDDGFVTKLREALPAAAFRANSAQYSTEPRGLFSGVVGQVVAPGSADEVAAVIALANRARVGVVPFGGGTGLVGGQVMPAGPAPLVLSLERMNAIRRLDPVENTAVAEAGVILQNLQDSAEQKERLFALSLASQGSCQIGGNLATNAGGVNVLRYGNARDQCLGLEAVLPNGQIWHGLKRLRKDNTGYDLRDLLIGAEGTLGVITAASLRLYPRPKHEATALFVVPGPAEALQLLGLARTHFGQTISAFELLGGVGLDFLRETLPHIRQPISPVPAWSVLIDVGTSTPDNPVAQLEQLFERAHSAGLASDGTIAQNGAQRAQLWQVRETIPEANKRIGSIASNDISLPLGAIAEFIAVASARISKMGDCRINCFGHLGDGNLHFNIFPAKGQSRADSVLDPARVRRLVHDLVAEYDGSFSAEHGVGRLKTDDLLRYGDPARIAAMRAIKTAFDPNGIMNPGAVLA